MTDALNRAVYAYLSGAHEIILSDLWVLCYYDFSFLCRVLLTFSLKFFLSQGNESLFLTYKFERLFGIFQSFLIFSMWYLFYIN